MLRSAGAFAESVRAVVIGVGSYSDPKLTALPECVRGARRVFDALVTPSACRLSPAHVACLTSAAETTPQAIRAALKQAGMAARSDDVIFIYFAGHGIDLVESFGLATSQTKYDQLDTTTISANDFVDAFGSSAARGLFLVCDCCGGAAIAEKSPTLFTALGEHFDYRIVLSASKSGQSSWEVAGIGSPFTNSLIDALEGKFPRLGRSGEIYFNDLFQFVSSELELLFDSKLRALPRQEPVFAGSYTKDPLVFMNSDATLHSIRVHTDRFSTAYVRRRVRQTVVGLTIAIAIVLVGLWTWLDQHRFIEISPSGEIAVYAGYPNWRFFGYPLLLWETGVRNADISPTSQVALSHSATFLKGEDIVAQVAGQLTAVGRARWLLQNGLVDDARATANLALAGGKLSHDEVLDGQEVLIQAASYADSAELVKVADTGGEIRTAVLKRLLQIDRPTAERLLASYAHTYFDWDQIEGLERPGCGKDLQAYVDWRYAREWSFSGKALDFLIRTGCKPPVIQRAEIRWSEIERNQALLRQLQNRIPDTNVVTSFANLLSGYDAQVGSRAQLSGAAAEFPGMYQEMDLALGAFLAFRPAGAVCDLRVQTLMERGGGSRRDSLEAPLVAKYLAYLLNYCTSENIASSYRDDQFEFGAEGGVRFAIDPATLESDILGDLARRWPDVAEQMAQAQLRRSLRTVDRLAFLAVVGSSEQDRDLVESLLASDDGVLQTAALTKLHASWRERFGKTVKAHIASLQEEAVLALAPITSGEFELRDEIMQALATNDRRMPLNAKMHLLLGKRSAAVGELLSPGKGRRRAAADLVAFRDDLAQIADELRLSKNPIAKSALSAIDMAVSDRARADQDLSSVAASEHVWRANLDEGLSAGGRLYLRQRLGDRAILLN